MSQSPASANRLNLRRRLPLGRSGLTVSPLGVGAAALGGEFGAVDEAEAVATVHAALEAGINLFDTAPAYGARRSESRLGAALAGVPRGDFVISTKAGKTLDDSGRAVFDYSEDGLRRSVDESARLLGVDVIDILHLHDFEYEGGRHLTSAFDTGFATLHALKSEGRIRAVGAGIYPVDLWKRVLVEVELDAILLHNHHTLCDLRAHELLPLAASRGVGIINAAPFASGLLSGKEPPAWHPAPAAVRRLFAEAARACEAEGVPIASLALAFSRSEARLPVTLFGCASRGELGRDLAWAAAEVNWALVAKVQRILEPVMNVQWQAWAPQPASVGASQQPSGAQPGGQSSGAEPARQRRHQRRKPPGTPES